MDYRVAVPLDYMRIAKVDIERELGAATRIVPISSELSGTRIPEGLDQCEALVPAAGICDEELMRRCPNLRLIAVPGTGVFDYVDVPAATRRGIAVANVRDYAADTVAEYTFALLLLLVRPVMAARRAVSEGRWEPQRFLGTELAGRTLGVVGYGSIGKRVAELAVSFGMNVLCATRRPDPARASGRLVSFVPFDDLLRESDFITLHASLTPDTYRLIGERELNLMRPTVYLINTARGKLIDTEALVAALEAGRLAGVGLDVTDPEPLPPSHPLLRFENVIVTPHIGARTGDALRRAITTTLRNIRAFFEGHPQNLVNPEVLKGKGAKPSC